MEEQWRINFRIDLAHMEEECEIGRHKPGPWKERGTQPGKQATGQWVAASQPGSQAIKANPANLEGRLCEIIWILCLERVGLNQHGNNWAKAANQATSVPALDMYVFQMAKLRV